MPLLVVVVVVVVRFFNNHYDKCMVNKVSEKYDTRLNINISLYSIWYRKFLRMNSEGMA